MLRFVHHSRIWRGWIGVIGVCLLAGAAVAQIKEGDRTTGFETSDPEWEAAFRERQKWWSLQPVVPPALPAVQAEAWCQSDLDRFVLRQQESAGLSPAAAAERRTLIRRLSFALTGLPPTPDEIETCFADDSPQFYEQLVDRLLASPHFGERWARHWMDVVHYADTHGYEWDVAAKDAWRYRDYLVRAFNDDVSFQQLVLEQIAGDLLPAPRIDPLTGLNVSLIGTAALRLGERRHGDSAEFEGIHQEAIENVIDTVTKAFQATTVACSRCHDHKFEAVSQRDYYALYGVFMSSRWVCRTADAADPNVALRPELAQIKTALRTALAERWLQEVDSLGPALVAAQAALDVPASAPDKAVATSPTFVEAWKKILAAKPAGPEQPAFAWLQVAAAAKSGESVAAAWDKVRADYARLQQERSEANAKNLRLVADFTSPNLPSGWQVEGLGLRDGFARNGEMIVADEGPGAVQALLAAGWYSHSASARLAGALRSPLLGADAPFLSVQVTAGGLAAQHLVVDNALFPESRYQFLDRPELGWLTVSTLPDDTKKGRRVYLELCTKALNNYYPPRTGIVAKYTPQQQDDPRSWFGVTRVFAHAEPGQSPQDELKRFEPLCGEPTSAAPTTLEAAANRYQKWFRAAIERWQADRVDADDVALLNWLLRSELLVNRADANPTIAALVNEHRTVAARVQADHVIGAVADCGEGRDDRLSLRGSYVDLGATVPRGYIRLFAEGSPHADTPGSGRLELARAIASKNNPLTARVFVNRVWHHLFGVGLVATVDDFGHLGERPSHPELLDYLAARFVDEGWSLKQLVRRIVLSATWRQSGATAADALAADPENRLLHHYPLRRLEAEAIRDAMLQATGRLDRALYGSAIDPFRRAEDKDKRLLSGALDGLGRRSLYTKMTLMEPPRFLALFNQPMPKLTVGRRDVTNVPDQALALLNDPFAIGQAGVWAEQLTRDGAASADERIAAMFLTALSRPPEPAEQVRFKQLVARIAELRQVPESDLLTSRDVWQDTAHAMFNLKEFIYAR